MFKWLDHCRSTSSSRNLRNHNQVSTDVASRTHPCSNCVRLVVMYPYLAKLLIPAQRRWHNGPHARCGPQCIRFGTKNRCRSVRVRFGAFRDRRRYHYVASCLGDLSRAWLRRYIDPTLRPLSWSWTTYVVFHHCGKTVYAHSFLGVVFEVRKADQKNGFKIVDVMKDGMLGMRQIKWKGLTFPCT